MSKHIRTLHFKTGSGTQNAQLYTTLGDVIDSDLINEDGTTGGITLYTTGNDTGYPALRVNDGGSTVYAKLVNSSDPKATNLRCEYNGTTYAVSSENSADAIFHSNSSWEGDIEESDEEWQTGLDYKDNFTMQGDVEFNADGLVQLKAVI